MARKAGEEGGAWPAAPQILLPSSCPPPPFHPPPPPLSREYCFHRSFPPLPPPPPRPRQSAQPEKHQDVVLRDSEGKVVWDDGERAAENNYIGACIHSGNVEALYYALCRKRARLERDGHEKAAGNFAKVWGGWLSTVEGSLGAQLAGLSAPALPEGQLLAAPVAGDDSEEALAAEEVAVGSISKEEWDAEVGEEDVVLGEGAKAAGAKGAAGKAGAPAQAGKPAKSNSGRLRGAKRAAT